MSLNEEQALINRAAQGDANAFDALWNAITPKLFGYLVNTVRDHALAEDILQSTWLKAIAALPDFTARGGGVSAWLFTIAKNECREHWRKSGRETPLDDEAHDRAADAAENHEEKLLIEQTLAALSENDREILRLRYVADLSMNEIAQVLKLNFVTVRVRVHRALAHAREVLST